MSNLLVISSAPIYYENKSPVMDIKFVEGMTYYSRNWNGKVTCMLKQRHTDFPFKKQYDPDTLPFNIIQHPEKREIIKEDIEGYDTILCSGDNYEHLHIAEICQNTGQKTAYIIENIVESRRQMIFLDQEKNLLKKIYSTMWMYNQERRRRKAFRKCNSIQANGYPAYDIYKKYNSNIIMYLDNRMTNKMIATTDEMLAREERPHKEPTVKIIHSGRLEAIKGSYDIIPIAQELLKKEAKFELHVFGTGSLESKIRYDIKKFNLENHIFMHGSVDFEKELVPFAKKNGDIYLSCHRQSDPSCTYLENMGCGLAVVGYDNHMWKALCDETKAGVAVKLGDTKASASSILRIAKNPSELIKHCKAAQEFALKHSFENEFAKRIDNLKKLVTT